VGIKDYMKKVNDEFEALIVPLLKSDWNSIQETLRIAQNKELSDKILRGMAQIRAGH
jgi:antitoxin of toxin-antitoxin stability system